MRVFLKCKNCGYENSCATEATSRVEFAMQEGEYKKITCKNCNYSHQYQPNDFYAKTSKVPQITASFGPIGREETSWRSLNMASISMSGRGGQPGT